MKSDQPLGTSPRFGITTRLNGTIKPDASAFRLTGQSATIIVLRAIREIMFGQHLLKPPLPPQHRRGAVSVWAIVCLVLVAALSASLAKLAIAGSRRMIQERRRVQADWLVQSGWSLALSQLRKDPAYTGETWEIPAADLGGADPGWVGIKVTGPAADAPDGKHQLQVVAEFPARSDHKVRVTRNGTWKATKP